MFILDMLAEKRIEQARDAGEFDNLPGAGKPLPDEDMTLVPEEDRVALRVLRNAGYVPREIAWHREALALATRLAMTPGDEAEQAGLLERLARINLCLSEAGKPQLRVPLEYMPAVVARLSSARTS